MTKIIYIASRDHSGSTLLDMLLSTHPVICGLGEAQGLINDEPRAKHFQLAHEKQCSCGKNIDECALWSNLSHYIEKNQDIDFASRYYHMMKLVYKEFGEDTILSDSSKYPLPLRQLLAAAQTDRNFPVKKEDIFVIHLIKDVRSYITSFKLRNKKNNNLFKLYKLYYDWCSTNSYMSKFLHENNINHIRISYESLCFNTELILKHICEKADIVLHPQLGNLNQATGHIGIGNPMRNHKVKSKKIIYDHRWFYESKIQLLYYLLPKIRKCNEQLTREQKKMTLQQSFLNQ